MKAIILSLLTVSFTTAAEPKKETEDLIPKEVPRHLRYSKPKIEDARIARNALIKEFIAKDITDLRVDTFSICHRIWGEIKTLKVIDSDKGVKLTSIDPNGTIVEGRVFREEAEKKIVWQYFHKQLHSKKDTKVRTPNAEELSEYWSRIGWDIEEAPLFIVERKKSCYFFAFSEKDLFQVIDFSEMKRKDEKAKKHH